VAHSGRIPSAVAHDGKPWCGTRLVALVILQTHPLKQNIPSSHQDFAVQRQFSRTHHPLYLILHTNKHPWDPLIKFF
jgi:hypothetical protein